MTLNIDIPPGFLPERTYTLRTLFTHFLGIEVEILVKEDAREYRIKCPQKELHIADAFFQFAVEGARYPMPGARTDVSLSEKTDPDNPNPPSSHPPNPPFPQSSYSNTPILNPDNQVIRQGHYSSIIKAEDVIILFGTDKVLSSPSSTHLHLDIIGGAFFMLTRLEETGEHVTDEHGRFPGSASFSGKHDLLLRPVVDEYCALLKKLLIACGVPESAFRKEQFRVNCTCDMDHPWYYDSMLHPLRHLVRTALGRTHNRTLAEEFRLARTYWKDSSRDPFDKAGWMMDRAEEAGTIITFYAMAGSDHALDPKDRLNSKRFHDLMQTIDQRGHNIGFHPGYTTLDDAGNFKDQWTRFREKIPFAKPWCRQHYLRFANPRTWQIQTGCRMDIDSTLGYADAIGFRCGTSKPYPVFDLENRRELPLIEQPLLLMDVTLKEYLEINPEEAMSVAERLIKQVTRYQGELTFLWHNSSFEGNGWENYESVFLRLLNAT